MKKDDLKEYLCRQLDMMSDSEIEELSTILSGGSDDEKIAEEMIMIRGELKKMTKLVYSLENKIDHDAMARNRKELKKFMEFDSFLKNFKDALDSLPKAFFWEKKLQRSIESLRSGFASAENEYNKILKVVGLARTAKVGERFDSEYHEVVETTEDRSMDDGIIVDILEEGYLFGDEVVNYAKVKVNKWT